ncbi:MAG: deoxyribose-phosphate aldolase [Herminiimonas sp.]|nr:deoxyribose-phosphate aldolase [Herminiimonas sp.]
MRDQNAQHLLATVMGWEDQEAVTSRVPHLMLLADYKYDQYQRFAPGKRFVESLALWLNQFDREDRQAALEFVEKQLVYFSDQELSHLVQLAYPDVIVQECLRLVAEEHDIASYRVGEISRHPRFKELQLKSLFLGLSDGARTNDLRRASAGAINNEQIWQAYELGDAKAEDMLNELRTALNNELGPPLSPATNDEIWAAYDSGDKAAANKLLDNLRPLDASQPKPNQDAKFNLIWLLDDFSGSGNTYIRFDSKKGKFKGKIKKIYERLHQGDLIDPSHYEVFLLLYVATRQAIDHIEYWSERFTSENGYKPLQLRVLCPIEPDVAVTYPSAGALNPIFTKKGYYDPQASDKHIEVGGTPDAQLGFAGCALPVVLSHNTPNNSVYLLWGPETFEFFGLFPRISRHKEL